MYNAVEYQRTYYVYFSEGYSAAGLVANTETGLPKRGNTHPDDLNSYVDSIDISLLDDSDPAGTTSAPGVASYVVNYKHKTIEAVYTTPLSRPAQIRWGGADIKTVKFQDASAQPFKNSAGDTLTDLPEQFVQGGEVSITRNEAGNPGNIVASYSNTVNSDGFYGVAAGNALMGKIEANKTIENVLGTSITFWTVTYPITFKQDGWRLKVYDTGYRVKDSSKLKVWVDENGQQPQCPIFLDGSGNYSATPVIYPTAGYKVYAEVAFGGLVLPNPFA
jgi:hypothetical protein